MFGTGEPPECEVQRVAEGPRRAARPCGSFRRRREGGDEGHGQTRALGERDGRGLRQLRRQPAVHRRR